MSHTAGQSDRGPSRGAHGADPPTRHEGSVKETIISMLIALAMALVAKVYVVEAFVIPTGSMAPTLLGQHMRFRSEQTGFEWAVNPWYSPFGRSDRPYSIQGSSGVPNPVVTDPMTIAKVDDADMDRKSLTSKVGFTPTPMPRRSRSGDRILVQKYLYEVFPPERYDVVVFKNPEDATMNFIKRLVGLPNEQVWLADGDVFARPVKLDVAGVAEATGPWQIQRKTERVQRSLWRPLFSSEHTPLEDRSPSTGRLWFRAPWHGDGWQMDGGVYRHDATDATLTWDSALWPITDWEPYNDIRARVNDRGSVHTGIGTLLYPISDLRMRAAVRAGDPGVRVEARLTAREAEFRAVVTDGSAAVEMRDHPDGTWDTLARESCRPFAADRAVNIEFWHVDQALSVWVDGRRIAHATYDWEPDERLGRVLGVDRAEVASGSAPLDRPDAYTGGRARVEWTFSGAEVELTRVGLDRDIFYQPWSRSRSARGVPLLGTHPSRLATMGPDQFFMLGDNSPSSRDGRLWDSVDRNIAAIDPTRGIVNRKLLLGKAFFVYWPAVRDFEVLGRRIPIPDFGSMRFIR